MTIITSTSDPELWATLYDLYVAEHNPRNVVQSADIYLCVINSVGEIEFHTVEPMEYIDSRSLKNSRSASYGNLDG